MTSVESRMVSISTKRRWIVALGFILAALVETVLLRYWATSLLTLLLAVGLLGFSLVLWLSPGRFFRRMSAACLTLVGASGALPSLDARIAIPGIARGSFLLEQSPWIALGALLLCGFFGYLEFRSRVPAAAPLQPPKKDPPGIQTAGADSPAAGGDQVIGGRDAAGRDVKRDEIYIEHVDRYYAAPSSSPVAPSAEIRVPRQLPSPPEDFTGRDDELAELLDQLGTSGASISGVEGMAGVGKTALTLVLADRLAGDYADGQFYLDLRGADPNQQIALTPSEIMRHVLLGFGPMQTLPDEEERLRALYLSALHGRRVLLLLDNAADGTQVEPLIPPTGCLMLITSRRHFVLPGVTPLNLDTLKEQPARELLLTICPRIGDRADEMADLCGYLPLALRVAGSALAVRPGMKAETYVTRLKEKRLELLKPVEAAIAVSEALLPEKRREHFRALSVFPESFDRTAAARVLELDQDAAHDELDALVACSLLQWNTEAERYHMHEFTRLFADQQLSGDRRSVLQMRHARVYCDVLANAQALYDMHGDYSLQGLALFEREWVNIECGFANVSARVTRDAEVDRLCSRYPHAGARCLALRQSSEQRIAWLQSAVDAAQRIKDAPMEANHLGNLGIIFFKLRDLDRAETLFREILEIDEKLGRWVNIAKTYGHLGLIFRGRGDLDKAEKMHRKSLEIEEKVRSLEGMAGQYGSLGLIFRERGDLDEAEKMHRKSLEINEKLRRLEGMASDYGNLGLIFQTRGDLDEAEKLHRKALEINEKLGRLEGVAYQCGNLGNILKKAGDLDEARRFWTKARDLFAQIGMPHMVERVQGDLDGL